jgi:hypothetical protein
MRRFVLPFALCLLAPALAQADSLRCGSKLASEGSTLAEVLVRCGEPMLRSTRYETLSSETKTSPKPGTGTAQVRTVTRTIDEWTYNFGSSEFMQLVTFVDGALVSVRSLSYGTD